MALFPGMLLTRDMAKEQLDAGGLSPEFRALDPAFQLGFRQKEGTTSRSGISVEVDGKIPSVGPNLLSITKGMLARWLQVPLRTSLTYLSCLPSACCTSFPSLQVGSQLAHMATGKEALSIF